MSTSSANPETLETFPGAVEPVADALRRTRRSGIDALDDFVAGAGEVPVSIDSSHVDYLDDLRREVDHLAGWVASVARGFRQVGSDVDGDGVFTAGDTPLSKLVGEPTRLEAEAAARGQDDARELMGALEEMGIDPRDFDPQDLAFLDPGTDEYRELFELIESHGDEMWSEDYAAAYFDVLGVEGVRATLGMIDRFAMTKDNTGLIGPDTDWMGDVADRLLIPFADGWARASGSVDLEEEREGLLQVDTWWEQRQLALLLAGDGRRYEPGWLADAADIILVTGEGGNLDMWDTGNPAYGYDPTTTEDWYPGMGMGQSVYDDPALGFNQLIALQALSDNVDASHEFALRGEDRLDVLVRPDEHVWLPPEMADGHGDDDLLPRLHDDAGEVITNAFLEAPYGVRDHTAPDGVRVVVDDWDAHLDAYDTFLDLVGDGDVPDAIKRDAARTLLPHLPAMAETASHDYLTSEIEDGRFSRPTLVDFFEELGYDEEAIGIAGEQLGAWGDATLLVVPADDLRGDEVTDGLRGVTLITDAAVSGLTANEDARDDAARSFWGGMARGTSFVLGVGTAALPVIVGGPVGAPVSLALATGTGLVSFGLGTAAAGAEGDAPEVDSDDLERLLTTHWRETMAEHHFAEGNLTTVDGEPLPDDASLSQKVNALTRLMSGEGGEDKFDEMRQTVGGEDYDADDDW